MTVRDTDDIVLTPAFFETRPGSAPVRERNERSLWNRLRDNPVFKRLQQVQRSRIGRMLQAEGKAAGWNIVGRIAPEAPGLAGAVARGAVNPITLAVAALVVSGAAVLRIATGTPLEKFSEDLNAMFLGDLDDSARAKMATRQQIEGRQDLMITVGREGRINNQVRSVFDQLYQRNLQTEIGATALRKAFPIDGLFGNICERAKRVFMDSFTDAGGPQALASSREAIQKIHGGSTKEGR